ncbi:SH3 domain-containing protein [Streptomyces sp. NPDC060027]|uniref:SH3 domain-containing protein n=1 Tax=Streptomyces sp. NPDC060027 TaxID=3347040 RepID=UPI003674541F
MALRSTYTRIGIALAAGSLVALAAATPALADGEGGSGSGGIHEWSNGGGDGGTGQTWNNGGGGGDGREPATGGGGDGGNGQTWNNGGGGNGQTWNNGGGGNGQTWNNGGGGNGREPATGNSNSQNNPRLYRGRISASDGLPLRSAPTRGSQLIRVARHGEIVSIYCKTSGQNVQGNPLWYLLTDGTWAWGAARYIDNIGPAPRWC